MARSEHHLATMEELEGDRRGGMALEHQREATSIALANRPGFDVALIPEEEFARGLERIRTRQVRLQRILDTVLVPEVHYGNPSIGNGRTAFKKPMLYQAGAEELRNFFRLHMQHVDPPVIVEREEYASVTVTLGIFDNAGRLLCVRTGNCNTREKRFERNDKKGFTYADAREMVHQCLAMAEKRAGTLGTREATGATGFFSAEEELDKALAGEAPAAAEPVPMTEGEKATLYAEAAKVGIKKAAEFKAFVQETLGRGFIGTGADVDALLAAIEQRKPGAAKPVQRAEESDEEIDRRLAAQG